MFLRLSRASEYQLNFPPRRNSTLPENWHMVVFFLLFFSVRGLSPPKGWKKLKENKATASVNAKLKLISLMQTSFDNHLQRLPQSSFAFQFHQIDLSTAAEQDIQQIVWELRLLEFACKRKKGMFLEKR